MRQPRRRKHSTREWAVVEPHREYRIAAELRRCCWYAIFGAVGLMIVFYWTASCVRNLGGADTSVGCILFALSAAAMTLPLRWRLRVDAAGVARRRFFAWDLWSWSDLGSGRIRKVHPCTLHDPERPWWRRWLRLGWLAPDDLQEVNTLNED